MKPKPFWVSNHLHVPFRRPFAPVQKDARIGANTADLPDHMARDLAIAMSLVDAKGEILYDSTLGPRGKINILVHDMQSFYISHRGFYAATRPPGDLRYPRSLSDKPFE
jgi:hypothetical protein